jgi:hypothetical protein
MTMRAAHVFFLCRSCRHRGLGGVWAEQQLRGAAAAQSDSGCARAAAGHPLSRADRQRHGGQQCGSGGARAEVSYADGALVKKGAPLFTIEPEPYEVKLQQAKAAESGAQATLKQAQSEFERQAKLVTTGDPIGLRPGGRQSRRRPS